MGASVLVIGIKSKGGGGGGGGGGRHTMCALKFCGHTHYDYAYY